MFWVNLQLNYNISPKSGPCSLNDLWQSRSHGVLPGPLPGAVVILGHVRLEEPCYLRHQGVVWVWVTQQRTYRQQHLQWAIRLIISTERSSFSPWRRSVQATTGTAEYRDRWLRWSWCWGDISSWWMQIWEVWRDSLLGNECWGKKHHLRMGTPRVPGWWPVKQKFNKRRVSTGDKQPPANGTDRLQRDRRSTGRGGHCWYPSTPC